MKDIKTSPRIFKNKVRIVVIYLNDLKAKKKPGNNLNQKKKNLESCLILKDLAKPIWFSRYSAPGLIKAR